MKQDFGLKANPYRECSLSIPSVEREALGGQHCIGRRAVAVEDDGDYEPTMQATGYVVGGYGQDPLDILCALEDE